MTDDAERQIRQAKVLQHRALAHIPQNDTTKVPITTLKVISDIVREQAAIEWDRLRYLDEEKQRDTPKHPFAERRRRKT